MLFLKCVSVHLLHHVVQLFDKIRVKIFYMRMCFFVACIVRDKTYHKAIVDEIIVLMCCR